MSACEEHDTVSEVGKIGEFLASHGGPFYELQLRLGMLRKTALNAGKRALIFVGLAWGVPLLLALVAGHAFGPAASMPFLLDWAIWARFFIAVGLFVLAERPIETQLRAILAQLVRAPILAPSSFEPAAQAVTTALKQRDSRLAEAICVVLAIAASIGSLINLLDSRTASWAVQSTAAGNSLTLAGWWCLVVSSPIFWFLLLRGLWRHLIWSMLLRKLAKLELRLVATHPDGNAGLAFIGKYPNAYATFIFGLSCMIGATLAHQLLQDNLTATTFGTVMGTWLAIVLGLFALPLSAFSKPLAALKERTLLASGAQATRYHRLAERKTFGSNIVAAEASEAEEQKEIGDPSKQFDTARKLSISLIDRSALVPIAAAAVLPLAAAGAAKLPYKELLSIMKKLLLL